MASDSDDFDGQTTVARSPHGVSAGGGAAFALTVVSGPDQGLRWVIDTSRPGRTLIGKSPACDLRLTDREVSRRHAAIEPIGALLHIVDLSSTNHTFVDGVRIGEAFAHGGETLTVGTTDMRIDAVDGAAQLPSTNHSFGRVVGASPQMRALYPLLERLAVSDVPVIIEGETGTGKEVVAEALHDMGARKAAPFVVFDCTTVAPSLIESELFGHERGAFTGAVTTRKGMFEQASGGTLFIDEIGDLELSQQPKLLRVLERSAVRRVGGSHWIDVDVRIIAATRRDLDREVDAGRFRDDLFHRLAVTRIELPPLRHREGDVALLARLFWKEFGGDPGTMPREVLARWEDSPWPGNVRELRNSVARLLAIGDLALMPQSLPDVTSASETATGSQDIFETILAMNLPFPQARDRAVEAFELRYVSRVLTAHRGNVTRAASASGIGRRYFQKIRTRASK